MKILVCMKAVPVTTQVNTDDTLELKRESVGMQWNIADESALEAALQLKGTFGTVTVLTMGPMRLKQSLHDLLGKGADRVVLLTDPWMAGADTFATANTLAAAVRKLSDFDLILCGRRAMDGETGQIPGMLAGALDLPCITNVESLQHTDDGFFLYRLLEEGTEKLRVHLPAVVSICEYSYRLRLPSILALRRAKQKHVELLTASDILLTSEQCGLKGSLTKVVRICKDSLDLRNGFKETDVTAGANKILQLCREVGL